ncbi:hypothetical protein ACI48D_13385 [Massilia sp. LXY-6]|uniref:hypothetical protein n=1 Tax=Massilia sp. LXY-6 TaxID=3379823 RepID=UPI003EE3C31B
MKFHLARPALVLASSLALASCGGGGGKETYPVKVTISNVQYPGLILTTNGQEVAVPMPAKAGDPVVVTFPKALDYGTYYQVVPKGGTAAGGGAQPAHQNCATNSYPREYGTAGQTASIESARTAAIEVFYSCSLKAYALSGTVTGLTSGSLTLINGSTGGQVTVTGSTTTTPIPFTLPAVAYGSSFSVDVFPQPDGFHCAVANGVGEMKETQEAAGGVTNVAVTCTPTTP